LTMLDSVAIRHCERFSPGAPPPLRGGQGGRSNLSFNPYAIAAHVRREAPVGRLASSQTALLAMTV